MLIKCIKSLDRDYFYAWANEAIELVVLTEEDSPINVKEKKIICKIYN